MNGAEAFIQTLKLCGVEVCFANPGTSEMQLVAAIDQTPGMRAILGLFEGVVTGAADGYGRMADKPAVTLLHLGPGLGNGLANLHNARRAGSPVINMVGDHATYHLHYNAPLTSDAAGVARPMSDWVRVSQSERDLAQAGAEAFAVAQSYPGKIATVIVPADHAWTEGSAAVAPPALIRKFECISDICAPPRRAPRIPASSITFHAFSSCVSSARPVEDRPKGLRKVDPAERSLVGWLASRLAIWSAIFASSACGSPCPAVKVASITTQPSGKVDWR